MAKLQASPGSRPKHLDNEADLAEYLIEQIRNRSGQDPVWYQNALYEYKKDTGVWEPYDRPSLCSMIQKLHKKIRPEIGRGSERGIAVTGALRENTVGCLENFCFQENFFGTKRGIAFADCFVEVTPAGLVKQKHAPENRAVFGYPFKYIEAEPTEYLAMLGRIFEPDEDRAQKIALLGEFQGACLLGIAPLFGKALVQQGEGSNGKNMVTDVMEALFPDRLKTNVKPQTWHREYYAAELAGKRINIVSEMPESEIIGSETFKAVITGDTITARLPTKAVFKFRPTAGNVFSCNRLSATNDQSDGFWRRIALLTYNVQFEAGSHREEILQRVLAQKPQIVYWILTQSVNLLARQHYDLPSSSHEAIKAWKLETDSVALFANQCITKNPDGREKPIDVYEAFELWCLKTRHKPMTANKFGRRLASLGFKKVRGDTSDKWVLTLKDQEEWEI